MLLDDPGNQVLGSVVGDSKPLRVPIQWYTIGVGWGPLLLHCGGLGYRSRWAVVTNLWPVRISGAGSDVMSWQGVNHQAPPTTHRVQWRVEPV